MFNIYFVAAITYISILFGITISKVGDLPNIPLEPYSWHLPILMLLVGGFPFLLGYLAGKDSSKKEEKKT